MVEPIVLTVTQLNTYIKSLLEGDAHLASVFVSGEISNFTNHYRSGHFYLSLKDSQCVVKSVMFAAYARRLRFVPKDGMKVIARGHVGVYEPTGQYQLYIEDLQPDGVGALNLAFEQLKEKLGAEGLFRADRKKSLPPFPMRIGVITSPTGAAVHDMVTILARRWPLAEIIFCPVLVQGEGAAPQMVDALRRMNRLRCADVILLGRGGGSLEDLWPFNEETLARAVAASKIPVISAVGHETDFTICDFVADLRAPTPSAAAELAVPDQADWLCSLRGQEARMASLMRAKLARLRQQLDALTGSRILRNPQELLAVQRMRIDGLSAQLSGCMGRKLADREAYLAELCGRLHALSPLAVLSRGYTIACGADGQVVTSAGQVHQGDRLSLQTSDGTIGCLVEQAAYGSEQEESKNGKKGDDI